MQYSLTGNALIHPAQVLTNPNQTNRHRKHHAKRWLEAVFAVDQTPFFPKLVERVGKNTVVFT